MTALITLERCQLDEVVTIDGAAVGTEGSSAYLKEGERLTVEELLYALMLQSANDAAVALAIHIGGDIEGFSALMNERADALGLCDTHFSNPHGLDDQEHYTTARELAIIAAEGMKNPTFKQICSTYKKTFPTEDRSRTYVNHNKLLRLYDGCVGVKTGFTRRSGRCLVGAAEKDGLSFISVTLDAPDDWHDHERMLDYGYGTLERIDLADELEYLYKIPVIGGERGYIIAANPEGAEIITGKGAHDIGSYTKLVRYAIAPINRGDKLGEIIYTIDGKEATRVQILATETVKQKKKTGFFDLFTDKH
jgi:D-alanyl-D-alanine carboxypeptidase/D-alanyl-D-alanine carboxypeptidase (penicillin-binding protein 5/6)